MKKELLLDVGPKALVNNKYPLLADDLGLDAAVGGLLRRDYISALGEDLITVVASYFLGLYVALLLEVVHFVGLAKHQSYIREI